MYDNEQYFFEALKAGACGYVLKSLADRDLVEACRSAVRDEPFVYPGAVNALIRNFRETSASNEDTQSDALTVLGSGLRRGGRYGIQTIGAATGTEP